MGSLVQNDEVHHPYQEVEFVKEWLYGFIRGMYTCEICPHCCHVIVVTTHNFKVAVH